MFFSVRYKVLLSGSAEDGERSTLPWLSSVTWSTSVSWRLPGCGGSATVTESESPGGASSPRLAGTSVTVPLPGGPLEVTFASVNVMIWPLAQVPGWVRVTLIDRSGASGAAVQPSAVTVIARNWSAVNRSGAGRYTAKADASEPVASAMLAPVLFATATLSVAVTPARRTESPLAIVVARPNGRSVMLLTAGSCWLMAGRE